MTRWSKHGFPKPDFRATCPVCKSRNTRLLRTPFNALRLLWLGILILIALALFPFLDELTVFVLGLAADLSHRCKTCGAHFRGEKPQPVDTFTCPCCEYDLRGNTSGRCPECGWDIPVGEYDPQLDSQSQQLDQADVRTGVKR